MASLAGESKGSGHHGASSWAQLLENLLYPGQFGVSTDLPVFDGLQAGGRRCRKTCASISMQQGCELCIYESLTTGRASAFMSHLLYVGIPAS